MINLLGDGQFATEYYNTIGESVFNNGTEHIDKELADGDIIRSLRPDLISDTEEEVLPLHSEIQPEDLPAIKDNNKNNCG